MITKQQIGINYIEEIRIKCDAKKIKYYKISKTFLQDFSRFRPILCLRAQKNNLELIILKKLTSKLTQKKKKKMIRFQKNYWKLSANSLGMITKQQIRINYIEESSIKTH